MMSLVDEELRVPAPAAVRPVEPGATALASPVAPSSVSGGSGTLCIAATFTAEGLEPPLRFLLREAGLALDLAFAPYHQVFQELIAPASALSSHTTGISLILVRLEDFLRDAAPGTDLPRLAEQTGAEFLEAARGFMRRSRLPAVFVVLDPSPSVAAGLHHSLTSATGVLAEALRASAGAVVLRSAEVDPLCGVERHDAVADRLAHIPYTDDYFAALALAITRQIHLLLVPAHKVLVLDCDNTLWRGVVGEDGPQGIGLDPAFLAVQRFAVAAQAKGTLVCLASKNVEADVLEVFEARPDMALKAEHIVAHRVNWEPKVNNLRSLARELNLGLDSFVFLDDNPVECGQVREALPEVVTLQLPEDGAAIEGFLNHLWTFDKSAVTQEDARRTAMYRENAARDSLEAGAVDIGEFLAALQLVIEIDAPTDLEWPRVAQLTQRTNQFNFTTRRRTEAEMRALPAAGSQVLAVHVRDRFGDYGLVGMVVADVRAGELQVDTFVLSCRVLGRGVEHAIVARLGALAVSLGLQAVRLPYRKTAKNEPARAFAQSIVSAWAEGEGEAFDYRIPAAVAAAITHRAGEDAPEVVEARRAEAKKPPAPAPAAAAVAGRSERYRRLATELTSGPAVLRAARASATRPRELAAAAVAPRSATERALLLLWEEILGTQGLGVDDDFFALGGSSLQAARMFADLSHRRGVSLPLTTIIEAPTVAELALRVDRGGAASAASLIALRPASGRKLFLVHDGDGETLLYRNLAHHLPAGVGVYGIQPARLENVPLAHDSIEAMAASYLDRVRAEQPEGPYLLGGMCAGGVIAYEMALQLERAGQPVERVLVLDAATPQAERRSRSALAYRQSRLKEAIVEARRGRRGLSALWACAAAIARKVHGAGAYKLQTRWRVWSERARFVLLKRVLAGKGRWPDAVPVLDFRAIYNAAERRYRPGVSVGVPAVLVRARTGQGSDQPYVEVFADPTLGWGSVAKRLTVVDVDGGHASMLQEPHAGVLADALKPHLVTAAEPRRAPVVT